MNGAPKRPSDPRDGEPYYIDGECSVCGSDLVLADEESGWYDEWTCPQCEDGLRMDWPDAEYDRITELTRRSGEDYTPLEDV
ncbi:MAG: hypothetical protein QXG03_05980 [Halalkalicoccus sp.]